ncbi:Uncharacterised protein [Sphingobacterium daejeonense]|nr:Uncharacterised protein [Sphingobacterium daejeonense]
MTYTQSYIQTQQPKPNALLWIARILVGLLFIFSGLIKANDPWVLDISSKSISMF